jgi:hypothetical protein
MTAKARQVLGDIFLAAIVLVIFVAPAWHILFR